MFENTLLLDSDNGSRVRVTVLILGTLAALGYLSTSFIEKPLRLPRPVTPPPPPARRVYVRLRFSAHPPAEFPWSRGLAPAALSCAGTKPA